MKEAFDHNLWMYISCPKRAVKWGKSDSSFTLMHPGWDLTFALKNRIAEATINMYLLFK
ncbi:MAG TPA: hypothetical protein PKA44_11975 [Saprospiraceae bacterium]|nr:hypothetical protein [Saprospiraceae bacterium]